jgi:hypothetical protein
MARPIDTLVCNGEKKDAIHALGHLAELTQAVRTSWAIQERNSFKIDSTLDLTSRDGSVRQWRVIANPGACLWLHRLAPSNDERAVMYDLAIFDDSALDAPGMIEQACATSVSIIDAFGRLAPADEPGGSLYGEQPAPWQVAIALAASRAGTGFDMDDMRIALATPLLPIELLTDDGDPIPVAPEAIAQCAARAPCALELEFHRSDNHDYVNVNRMVGIPGENMPSLATPTDVLRAVQMAVHHGALSR